VIGDESKMHSAVTISLVEQARGGPFVFWHDLAGSAREAADLGFDAIEVFAREAEQVPQETLRQTLAETGLKLAAVGTGAGWVVQKLTLTSPDESIRRGAVAFIESMIDFGGAHGAPAIVGSMQGRWNDGSRVQTLDWLRTGLEELAEHARRRGVSLLFEPINRYETNLCNSVEAGVELIASLQTGNVQLLADLFHMNIEEVDVPAAIRSGNALIGHVHFVDSNRRPVGCGHLDVAAAIRALQEIGYQGYLSAEALPWPNPFHAAKQTIAAFRYFTGK
jgi:sugar phosphate isomerase/epimerase